MFLSGRSLTKSLQSNAKFYYQSKATFAISSNLYNEKYQLVIVGGGSGGCSTAAKFTSKLGKGKVAVIEPSEVHYYQPLWTLVGGGMKDIKQSIQPMGQVLPQNAKWFKNRAVEFMPEKNVVVLNNGKELCYEFLVIAMGLQLNYSEIKGLPEAFETPGVCSNYSALYVEKTEKALHKFQNGNLIFTHPSTAIKCPGASQKILYIAEEYLQKNGKRDGAKLMFNTAGGLLFGVKKYADALWKIVEDRNIQVNLKHNLIEVIPERKEAVFAKMDSASETVRMPYEVLHVTPPMSAPDCLRTSNSIVDENGFVNLNKDTLRHVNYSNIFAIGDCTNLPTSKTVAAVAAQLDILEKNLSLAMKGESVKYVYDGYTSCPLVTGYSKCILAEFDYDGKPLETFPFNQAKERRLMFHLKKDMMPHLYWKAMLNGFWGGPKIVRKVVHLGFSK